MGFQLRAVFDEPGFRLPRYKTEEKLGIRYNGIFTKVKNNVGKQMFGFINRLDRVI